MTSGVAERYALALFELAEETGATQAVASDLTRFEAMISDSADLARLVRSPAFSAQEQLAGVSGVLERAEIGGVAGNFIRLVAEKRRLFALPEMIAAYRAAIARRDGVVEAEVVVAEPLSAEMDAQVRAALVGVAGPKVSLRVLVNPDIIGGMIVKLGSRMIDASLKTKLNALRLAMKEVG